MSERYVPYMDTLYPTQIVVRKPYPIQAFVPRRAEMVAWCADQGMEVNIDYHMESYIETSAVDAARLKKHVIRFRCKQEHHALAFKLRWG